MLDIQDIPLNSLDRGIKGLEPQISIAVSRVIRSGWFVLGPEHDALEKELAEYLGTKHSINVGNGTDALEIALSSLGVSTDDYVITVANAGAYTTIASRLLGAVPIYCDVDPHSHLMSPDTLKQVLALCPEKPKAIVITHLYGALAPVAELVEIANQHGIATVEDCAQSLGSTINGKMGGTFADIATTSFYPTKNFGALGDGGAIFTNDLVLADSARKMRQYGWESKYSIEHSRGRNSRLDEIQAAILRVKLPYLDSQNQKRRNIHSQYELSQNNNFKLVNSSNDSFNGHLAVAVSNNRDKDRAKLSDAGVKTDIHYPIPDHLQKIPGFTPVKTPLEVTEWASQAIYSIPLFPELTDLEVERVSTAVSLL